MSHVSIRTGDSRAATCCDCCVRFSKRARVSRSSILGGLDRLNSPTLVPGMTHRHAEVHARWEEHSKPGAQHVPAVLTIAGSDSGGGAGIQADLKTLAACGVFGTSAITALTAQNTQGVFGIEAVSAAFVSRQIDAVLDDIPVTVIKTGMLPSLEVVQEVAAAVRKRPHLQLVVDPVLVATSGDSLTASEVGQCIAEQLFPLATVITPNLTEASALLGGRPVEDLDAMQAAAKQLHSMGPCYVLVKGGHLRDMAHSGTSDATAMGGSELADVLYDGSSTEVLTGPRIRTGNTHGTGCTTASAIAAFLARGLPPPAAVRAARSYVTQALRSSAHLQIGSGSQRPFNHLFAIDNWQTSRSATELDLRLYAVTDPACNQRYARSNAEVVNCAIEGGVTVVQLREKDANGGEFCQEAEAVLSCARPRGVKVLINDRVDVALAVDADGVHVGQDDIPAKVARRLLGPGKILGVSVKTVEQALRAEADGADYLGAGAMHVTATKDSSTITLETLRAICSAVSIPVVAIGGINAENAAECIQAGCAGVAVVSAIFGAESPSQAAGEIRRQIELSVAPSCLP